jgi:Signal peptide peptidase
VQAAQPALLYIVPAVLGAVAVHAQLRGEFLQVNCSMCILKLHASESADADVVGRATEEPCVQPDAGARPPATLSAGLSCTLQVFHFSEAAEEKEEDGAAAAVGPAVAAEGNGTKEAKKLK